MVSPGAFADFEVFTEIIYLEIKSYERMSELTYNLRSTLILVIMNKVPNSADT